MWINLDQHTWPEDGYYWIRRRVKVGPSWTVAIALIERNRLYRHGSSLLTESRFDTNEWELFTTKIVEPAVAVMGGHYFI